MSRFGIIQFKTSDGPLFEVIDGGVGTHDGFEIEGGDLVNPEEQKYLWL